MYTKIIKPRFTRITAAEEETDEFFEDYDEDADGIMDAVDDVADNLEDIKDAVDEVDEDDVDIALNNNISNHYIAECEKCQGIFISAVVESDQEIDHVSGICPLCKKETDQYLKWIVRDINSDDDSVEVEEDEAEYSEETKEQE